MFEMPAIPLPKIVGQSPKVAMVLPPFVLRELAARNASQVTDVVTVEGKVQSSGVESVVSDVGEVTATTVSEESVLPVTVVPLGGVVDVEDYREEGDDLDDDEYEYFVNQTHDAGDYVVEPVGLIQVRLCCGVSCQCYVNNVVVDVVVPL